MTERNGTARAPRYALIATLAALLALTGTAATVSSAQKQPTQHGIENFGKVNDNYYRGGQPRGEDFAELKRLGVKTVLDLRKDSERGAEDEAKRHGLRYVNLPLTTKQAATDEQTAQFLKLVNDPDNWPVFVHCKGGRHRTGAMTAVFRITRDGWTAEQAFEEMKQYDFNSGRFLSSGKGRAVLKQFVFDFYERFRAAAQNQQTAAPHR